MTQPKILDSKIIFLSVLFVIGATVLLLIFYSNKGSRQVDTKESKVDVEYVAQNTLPHELPTDLPIEGGAVLVRNEIIKVKNSTEVQYVRTYYSNKTVGANFDIYKKYLTQNDWDIALEQRESALAILIADKAGKLGTMSVTISENSVTRDVTVELNVVVK